MSREDARRLASHSRRGPSHPPPTSPSCPSYPPEFLTAGGRAPNRSSGRVPDRVINSAGARPSATKPKTATEGRRRLRIDRSSLPLSGLTIGSDIQSGTNRRMRYRRRVQRGRITLSSPRGRSQSDCIAGVRHHPGSTWVHGASPVTSTIGRGPIGDVTPGARTISY